MSSRHWLLLPIAACITVLIYLALADVPTVYSIPGLQRRIESLEARVAKLEACE